MTKLGQKLQELGIPGDREVLMQWGETGKEIGIIFVSRDCPGLAWGSQVWSPLHNTDPSAPWHCLSRRTFPGRRSESMAAARQWAAEKYGITKWTSSPFDRNSWLPADVVAIAIPPIKDSCPSPGADD